MGRSILSVSVLFFAISLFPRPVFAEPAEKKVWLDFYELCLKAEQGGQPARVLKCRDQAAKANGYESWGDFVRKAKKALGSEVWARIQLEANKWYRSQPGAGGPRRGGFGGLAEKRVARKGAGKAAAKGPRKEVQRKGLVDWDEPPVGTEMTLELAGMSDEKKARNPDLASKTMEILTNRLAVLGVEYRTSLTPDGKIVLGLPPMGREDVEAVKRLVLMVGRFDLRLVADEALADEHRGKKPPPNHRWLKYATKGGGQGPELVMIDDGENFGAELIERAYVAGDGLGFPAVGFDIKKKYRDRFVEFTAKHARDGRKLALIMDDAILSAPVLRDAIRAKGIISGGARGFDVLEQKILIAVLNTRPYPARLAIVQERRK